MSQPSAQYSASPDHASWSVTTAPATEPVTLTEAKAHLRKTDSDDDTYIGTLIQAARETVENRIKRALITQTITLTLDGFPRNISPDFRRVAHDIVLPQPPLISVTSVTYTDTAGDSTVLDSSGYSVDTASSPGRIMPAYGEVWPSTQPQTPGSVVVVYQAGYGAAASVPASIKQAMLILIAGLFESREPVVIGTIASTVPETVDALLANYTMRGGLN